MLPSRERVVVYFGVLVLSACVLASSTLDEPEGERCVFIVVDPQEEFFSNDGILQHSHADFIAASLAERAALMLKDGCRVFVTAALIPPQDCSFVSDGHVTEFDVANRFFGYPAAPLDFTKFVIPKEKEHSVESSSSGQKQTEQPPPPDPVDDQVKLGHRASYHPTLSLRSPYIRRTFPNCLAFRRCYSDDSGKIADLCKPLPGVIVDDPECSAEQPLFLPNRVMAPGGGGAISHVFIEALERAILDHDIREKLPELFFLLRGFGAADVVFSSLLEQHRNHPSKIENVENWATVKPWTLKDATGDDGLDDTRCIFQFSSIGDTAKCDKRNEEEFASLLGSGRFVWREARTASVDEHSVSSSDEECPGKAFQASVEEMEEDTRKTLANSHWPPFATRTQLPHTCPTSFGPTPHKLHSLCRTLSPTAEFEAYITESTSDVRVVIGGVGFENTILHTALDIKDAVPEADVTVLAHLSLPLLHPQPPNEQQQQQQLPPNISPHLASQFLSLKRIKIEHGSTFSATTPLSVGGWYSRISKSNAQKVKPDEDGETESEVVSVAKQELSVISWDLSDNDMNPFSFRVDTHASGIYGTLIAGIESYLSARVHFGASRIKNTLIPSVPKLALLELFPETRVRELQGLLEGNGVDFDDSLFKVIREGSEGGFLEQLANVELFEKVRLADRASAVAVMRDGTEKYRPGVGTCWDGAAGDGGAWWLAWKEFMFSDQFLVSPIANIREALKKVPDHVTLGEYVVNVAVVDGVFVHVATASQDQADLIDKVKSDLCAGHLSPINRWNTAVKILTTDKQFSQSHVMALHGLRESRLSALSSTFENYSPIGGGKAGPEGKSVLLLRKDRFLGKREISAEIVSGLSEDLRSNIHDLVAVIAQDRQKEAMAFVAIRASPTTIKDSLESILATIASLNAAAHTIISLDSSGFESQTTSRDTATDSSALSSLATEIEKHKLSTSFDGPTEVTCSCAFSPLSFMTVEPPPTVQAQDNILIFSEHISRSVVEVHWGGEATSGLSERLPTNSWPSPQALVLAHLQV